MNKIDIIIPVYKATETLPQALASIAIQSVLKDIRVTIVVDGDGLYGEYDSITEKFEKYIDVDVIPLINNHGVGYARQYGIGFTSNPYIMFLDADDTFAGAYAVEMLRNKLESDANNVVAIGMFFEKRRDMSFVKHDNDTVWVHGKIYKRSYLDKYDIRFMNSSANEDAGFNAKVRLLETPDEHIVFLPNLVYYWQWNESGITRVNNSDYTYNASYIGYVENMIDAINHAKKYLPNDDYIGSFAISCLAQIYMYYARGIHFRPDLREQMETYAKKYYNEIIVKYEIHKNFEKEIFDNIVSQIILEQYPNIVGFTISITFDDFEKILLT